MISHERIPPIAPDPVSGRLANPDALALQPLQRFEIVIQVRIAEDLLGPFGLGSAHPGSLVKGAEQGHAQSRTACSSEHSVSQLVGIFVRCSVGLVVEIVKLSYPSDTRFHHLHEDGLRYRFDFLRVEEGGGVIHQSAPTPEVFLPRLSLARILGAPANSALKGVAVGVHKPGDKRAPSKTPIGDVLTFGLATSDFVFQLDCGTDRKNAALRDQDSVFGLELLFVPEELGKKRIQDLRLVHATWHSRERGGVL